MSQRNLVISAVILGVLAAGGLAYKLKAGGSEEQQQGFSMPVETAHAEKDVLRQTVQAVGTLVANEGVIVRPEISGRIIEILFNEGQQIEKGQPLLRLDDSVYKAQVAQAEAQVALAERNYARAQSLLGRGAGTEQARDQANSDQKVASAALELAKANLDKTLISASFTGMAGIRKVSLGDYVSPGQDLVTLQALNPMKIDFSVPETALATLAPGLKLNLTVSAYPGTVFEGQVVAVDPLVDPSTRSVAVRAQVPNADGRLRPGMFGQVNLVLKETPDTVFIPGAALWPVGDKFFVFKVSEGMASMTPVELLQRDATRAAVTGLSPQDEVVTAGQMKLASGGGQPMPVMVTNAPPAAAPESAPAATTPAETK